MKRSELKQLIKECLSEILQEGLGNVSAPVIQERVVGVSAKPKPKAPVQPMRRPGDTIRYGKVPQAQNEVFEHRVSETVNTLTQDPLLSSIFADTAKTTLQEQNSKGHSQPSFGAGGAPPRGTAEQIASAIDPMEIFGAAAQNWAEIAFASKKR